MRHHVFEPLPEKVADTKETFDCVVLGGGISGLSAGLFFCKSAGKKTCLILENHSIFGGEARRNEFPARGERLIAHQGSAMYPLPAGHVFIGILQIDIHSQRRF